MRKKVDLVKYFRNKDSLQISSDIQKELEEIENYELYSKTRLNNLKPFLENMIKHSTKKGWLNLLLSYENTKDSSSLKRFIHFYGDNGQRLFDEKNKKCINYGSNPRKAQTLDNFVLRYGKENGVKKYENYIKKWVSSMKESRIKNKWESHPNNLNHLIKKHGIEKGTELYQERRNKAKLRTSKEEFLKTHTLKEWDDKLKFLAEMSYCNNKRSKGNNYSNISQKLFFLLLDKIEDKENVFFAKNNKEKRFWVGREDIKYISVDFLYGNKIIEFDGTYWHSSKKIIKKDKLKTKLLENKGYEVLRIKEKDFNEAPHEAITKCCSFLGLKYD